MTVGGYLHPARAMPMACEGQEVEALRSSNFFERSQQPMPKPPRFRSRSPENRSYVDANRRPRRKSPRRRKGWPECAMRQVYEAGAPAEKTSDAEPELERDCRPMTVRCGEPLFLPLEQNELYLWRNLGNVKSSTG